MSCGAGAGPSRRSRRAGADVALRPALQPWRCGNTGERGLRQWRQGRSRGEVPGAAGGQFRQAGDLRLQDLSWGRRQDEARDDLYAYLHVWRQDE